MKLLVIIMIIVCLIALVCIIIGIRAYKEANRTMQGLEKMLELVIKDEFKESLRNRSGRISYIITLLVVTLSMIVFSIIGSLGILDTNLLVRYLAILWIFMYVIGIIIYRILLKKYQ